MTTNSAMFINAGDCLKPAPKGAGGVLLEKMPKATFVRMTWNRGRSDKHDGLFFKAISVAFKNWPELHEFQPENTEHLRAWLLCKAGHRNVLTHEVADGVDPLVLANIVQASIEAVQVGKADKGFAFIRTSRSFVYVITPKSMKHIKVASEQFSKISEAVSEILKEHTGLNLTEYKNQFGKEI